MTQFDPTMEGLYPSIGNGFISANVGCLPGGAATFPIHVGGVFNNQLKGKGLSIPHRADIPNPFAVPARLQNGTLQRAATALDLEHGLFMNATAYGKPEVSGQIITTQYAHRAHRALLVLELAWAGATGMGDSITVALVRCSGPINWRYTRQQRETVAPPN